MLPSWLALYYKDPIALVDGEGRRVVDAEGIQEDRQARLDLQMLSDTDKQRALAAAESLLGWLNRRAEERTDGDG